MLVYHFPFRALILTVMGSLFFAMMGVAQTPIVLDPPAGTEDGVNVVNGSTVIIQLRAPGKDYVHLRGDFNNFAADDASLMRKSVDGNRHWLQLSGLSAHAVGVLYTDAFEWDGVMS